MLGPKIVEDGFLKRPAASVRFEGAAKPCERANAYRVQGRFGDPAEGGTGVIQYQNAIGRYEFEHDRINGDDANVLSASGGLVAIGGTVQAARPVDGGFALVRVPAR